MAYEEPQTPADFYSLLGYMQGLDAETRNRVRDNWANWLFARNEKWHAHEWMEFTLTVSDDSVAYAAPVRVFNHSLDWSTAASKVTPAGVAFFETGDRAEKRPHVHVVCVVDMILASNMAKFWLLGHAHIAPVRSLLKTFRYVMKEGKLVHLWPTEV